MQTGSNIKVPTFGRDFRIGVILKSYEINKQIQRQPALLGRDKAFIWIWCPSYSQLLNLFTNVGCGCVFGRNSPFLWHRAAEGDRKVQRVGYGCN